jgi:hypothetical protein
MCLVGGPRFGRQCRCIQSAAWLARGTGKQLGSGLAEFRLRHDEREVLGRESGSTERELPDPSPEKILLRVFFHAHGNHLILLLSGYDKGARPNARHQQREVERARVYLKEWRAMQALQRRSRRRR